MNFLQAEIPLDWDENSLLIPSKKGTAYTGPLKIPYTCEDGVLKISTRAYSMDFNALSDEEQADYEANGSGTLGGAANMIVQGLLGGMEGGLAESLLFDLALGMMGSETEPIPEGEPSKGPVTGTVDGMEFTVLGTDSLQYEGEEYIVFYYDAVNVSDQLNAVWTISTDAAQDGELLEEKWDVPEDVIPEQVNANYEVYPGRTIRCANIYHYDPDGGPVVFTVFEDKPDGTKIFEAAKIVEVK